MDNRKKSTQLRMERDRGGWAVTQAPASEPTPAASRATMPMPTPMPIPMPAPMPATPSMPMPVAEPMMEQQPAQECGYCITLAMAYVPMQEFSDIYDPEQGIGRGTIFAELDLPFMGKGDCRRG